MKSFTRTCFVVAAASGLFVCGMNTLHLREKIARLHLEVQNQTQGRAQAETALMEAQTEVRSLSGRLTQTRATLETVTEERLAAVAAANVLKVRLMQAAVEKLDLGRERDEAQLELAQYKYGGLGPEQILKAALYIKKLESRLSKLQVENQALHKKIVGLQLTQTATDESPKLPTGLKGKVVAYDPKWRFMVLDIGEAQGALPRGEMLISREGKLVAKIQIARVESNRCIANLLSNWGLGGVMEGDLAQPAI